MHILALAAHPDDPEIFCGGTLLRYLDAGHEVFVALATSGNIGSTTHASREEIAAVREAEALAGAAILTGLAVPGEAVSLEIAAKVQERVTGQVTMKLHKGRAMAVARTSPYSLYDYSLATYATGDVFNPADSPGFIRLWGLPARIVGEVGRK